MPDVPDGSIVISQAQFYSETKEALVEIKVAVSGLPALRDEIKDLKLRVSQLEKFRWMLAGVAAAGTLAGGAISPQIFGG